MKPSPLFIAPIVLMLAPVTANAAEDRPAASDGDESAKIAALTKVKEGAGALDEGDYARALNLFEQAYRLYASPKIFFNIGLANVGLARYPEALNAFERFISEADGASASSLAEARTQIETLRGRVGTITILSEVDGAELVIDGKPHGATPLKGPVYLQPGSHQLLAHLPYGTPVIQQFEATAGKQTTVNIEVPRQAVTKPPELEVKQDPGRARSVQEPGPEIRKIAHTEPAPFYKSPWFWGAAGGAVLVGVVITAVVLSGDSDPDTTLGRF